MPGIIKKTARLLSPVIVAFITGIIALGFALPSRAEFDLEWGGLQDPSLRAVLFDLQQGNNFTGINRSIALKMFIDLNTERDTAELLLCTLYLSYGMSHDAMDILSSRTERGLSSKTQDRLWFYLAKSLYRRNALKGSSASLDRIQGTWGEDLDNERKILEALIWMRHKQFQVASKVLKHISGESVWSLYGQYNLGIALARDGSKDKSVELLEQVAKATGGNDEILALNDKANVELGYLYLQDQNPLRAKSYFQQAHLQGPLSSKALLGLGLTYVELNRDKNALVVWKAMAERNSNEPLAIEALSLLGYTYGRLADYRQSLSHYQKAIKSLEIEIQRIDTLLTSVRIGAMLAALLQQPVATESEHLKQTVHLPAIPGRHYLIPIFSSHMFQETFRDYRDIKFLADRLQVWWDKVELFGGISRTFHRSYMDRIEHQQNQSAKVLLETEDYLQQLVITSLEAQKKEINYQLTQARFSMARIYDRAARDSANGG